MSNTGSSTKKKEEVSRLVETSYLTPYQKGKDAYAEKRQKLIKLMESRGCIPESMTEENIGFYHLDVFGHVSGPSLSTLIHGALDRQGSWGYERVLGIRDAQGLCTGRGPITVLPRKVTQTYRIPVTWPDAVLIGVRPIAFDEKTGQFGNDFELFSLKTGQLCYRHTIIQSLIDVTKGGRAVHINKLAEGDEKWKHWREWWNGHATNSQKLLAEAEAQKSNSKRSAEIEKQKDLSKTRHAKL
ncbi:uncharacterized protein FA14DRAFT_182331 [Meira miltonrushii]|uniref:Thioesterase/thiol ester dehydrase-isomerase n=1 Tax=Meira miltonrushii TaxID=1280837 RepID=A0A316V3G0_9BASI|nr:uncharacterized protein FA14DRAFT_182331 [Meira miltonrushii]PWN31528.1 hypothetical protein FA14DRAFT_182331 [Meira miltonrushii]